MKLLTVLFSTITVLFSFIFTTVVKVDVCHATGSTNNPYVLITVAIHSVDDATGLNGHGDHVDDAWMAFVFEDVTYPGQNEGLFGTIIDGSCNLIVPPTDTPIPPTDTPTSIPPTFTPIPPTFTPTSTNVPPTFTPTYTNTPTVPTLTSTPTRTNMPPTPTDVPPTLTNTPTGTWLPPTNTPTIQATNTPTSTMVPPTSTLTSTLIPPTHTPTFTPTSTMVPPTATFTPQNTNTPFPPHPASANDSIAYSGRYLGEMVIGAFSFALYQGVNAADGSLMLPSLSKGAALYQSTIWVHRLWHAGWLSVEVGDVITIKGISYKVVSTSFIDYGEYPKYGRPGIEHIATCYSDDKGNWVGVQLYEVEPVIGNHNQ